jgi:hypothetical protein
MPQLEADNDNITRPLDNVNAKGGVVNMARGSSMLSKNGVVVEDHNQSMGRQTWGRNVIALRNLCLAVYSHLFLIRCSHALFEAACFGYQLGYLNSTPPQRRFTLLANSRRSKLQMKWSPSHNFAQPLHCRILSSLSRTLQSRPL